jgi:NAD(P)-dependent dehydrogenase (short-subunit alcohol dehydrogenase family)
MGTTPSTSPFDNGHVFISGGSGGIGAAVCELVAARGLVPIVGYNTARATAEDIAARCGGMALHLDLRSESSIDAAIARLAAPDIRLIGVVLAGSPPLTLCPFGKISPEEMMSQLSINVIGPQRLLAGVIRGCFRKTRQGSVVGVLTKAMGENGQNATPGLGAYVIAKHGLAGVLAALAASYSWLRVGWVKPGFTETAMLKSFDERFLSMMREKERFQTPAEVAGLVVNQVLGPAGVDAPVV